MKEMIYIRAASLSWIICLLSAATDIIKRSPGEDALLKCKADKKGNFMVVKWTKSDLKDKYVFLQVDGHIESANQHPSFKNRVELQDRQMKDGNVSLILKKVTAADSGTYECRVKTQTNRRKRENLEAVNTITLRVVDPPGPEGGRHREDGEEEDGGKEVGLIIGLAVVSVLFAVVVVLVTVGCFRSYRR